MYSESSSPMLHLSQDYVYVKRTQSTGESDLVKLARTLHREVVWVYDPQAVIWYNVPGKPAVFESDGQSLQTVGLETKSSSFPLASKRMTEYHTHPQRIIDELTAIELGLILQEQRTGALERFVSKTKYIGAHMPSGTDLSRWVQMIEGNQEAVMSFAVVAPSGISYVTFQPEYPDKETALRFNNLLRRIFPIIAQVIDDQSKIEGIRFIASLLNKNDLGLHIVFDERQE